MKSLMIQQPGFGTYSYILIISVLFAYADVTLSSAYFKYNFMHVFSIEILTVPVRRYMYVRFTPSFK